MVVALFSFTLFVSAFLLFCIEPLVAKMLLPVEGGAAAVWSTCLVFFQTVLLAGYAFTHFALRRMSPRRHALVYVLLVPVALWTMPFDLAPRPGTSIALGLLAALIVAVGPSFFVLATLAPALQRWFVATGSPRARDPYFLYAASNAGSLLALAAYPFAIEPTLDLHVQTHALRLAFVGLALLLVACAVVTREDGKPAEVAPPARIGRARRLRWMLLAAVPSAQLVAVTTFVTTDVAPAPLLWVVPLSVYLTTFIVVFARRRLPQTAIAPWLPLVVVAGLFIVVADASEPVIIVVALHMAVLFAVGVYCHGAIAEDRPDAAHLPEYFTWMSLGGAVGGAAVALGAPVLLTNPVEYPLCLLVAAACRPTQKGAPRFAWLVVGLSALLAFAAVYAGSRVGSPVAIAVLLCVPFAAALLVDRFPRVFVWTLAVPFVIEMLGDDARHRVVHRERSFFGAFSLVRDDRATTLMHGTTMHGLELVQAPKTPTLYYTTQGPIGDVMTLARGTGRMGHVAVIGLGTGTLATYARPGDSWRFFELDPAIARIARDPRWFTFMTDAFGPSGGDVVVGDARMALAAETERYDLLVVDAFTSDAIPTHLLTREAFAVYRTRLLPGGIIAWHVSNRHLDLHPVIAALAEDARWAALRRTDDTTGRRDERLGSDWVAVAESADTLDPLLLAGWTALTPRPGFRCWTDERASIVSVWAR